MEDYEEQVGQHQRPSKSKNDSIQPNNENQFVWFTTIESEINDTIQHMKKYATKVQDE